MPKFRDCGRVLKWFPKRGTGVVSPIMTAMSTPGLWTHSTILVHTNDIVPQGGSSRNRSLAEGTIVEFEVVVDKIGKAHAKNITGPSGAPPIVSQPEINLAGLIDLTDVSCKGKG